MFKFFEKEEYIAEFRSGKIRLMSAYYYATKEQSSSLYNNRFDSTEGESFLYNNDVAYEPKTLHFGNDTTIKLGSGVKKMLFNGSIPNEQIKISCFYVIDKEDIPDGKFVTVLDTMKDSLGEYYIAFYDPFSFASRIQVAIAKRMSEGMITNFMLNRVKYYNAEEYTGFSHPLDKPDGLSWQKEYRLIINTVSEPDPFYLNIGDIRDITVWGMKEDLYDGYVENNTSIFIPNHLK